MIRVDLNQMERHLHGFFRYAAVRNITDYMSVKFPDGKKSESLKPEDTEAVKSLLENFYLSCVIGEVLFLVPNPEKEHFGEAQSVGLEAFAPPAASFGAPFWPSWVHADAEKESAIIRKTTPAACQIFELALFVNVLNRSIPILHRRQITALAK